MARPKRQIKGYTVDSSGERAQYSLAVLGALKESAAGSAEEIANVTGLDSARVAERINACVKNDILSVKENGEIGFNTCFDKMLGVGFTRKEAVLVMMDLAGNILKKEKVLVPDLFFHKGRVKELKAIASDIGAKKEEMAGDLKYLGVAVPSVLTEKNSRAPKILGESLAHEFNCDVVLSPEATAAGYAEKDFFGKTEKKDILYLHSDIGYGVVIKGEGIFEARDSGDKTKYLRSWEQFSAVKTARDLINKGVGTDIVNLIDGEIDGLDLEVVLEAAGSEDELAEDLIKRAGLALGVRAAYLVNTFNVDLVVLGGGTEDKKGYFASFVKESSSRFLLDEAARKVKIITGALGKEASSTGAASLCRRELFMEV